MRTGIDPGCDATGAGAQAARIFIITKTQTAAKRREKLLLIRILLFDSNVLVVPALDREVHLDLHDRFCILNAEIPELLGMNAGGEDFE